MDKNIVGVKTLTAEEIKVIVPDMCGGTDAGFVDCIVSCMKEDMGKVIFGVGSSDVDVKPNGIRVSVNGWGWDSRWLKFLYAETARSFVNNREGKTIVGVRVKSVKEIEGLYNTCEGKMCVPKPGFTPGMWEHCGYFVETDTVEELEFKHSKIPGINYIWNADWFEVIYTEDPVVEATEEEGVFGVVEHVMRGDHFLSTYKLLENIGVKVEIQSIETLPFDRIVELLVNGSDASGENRFYESMIPHCNELIKPHKGESLQDVVNELLEDGDYMCKGSIIWSAEWLLVKFSTVVKA